MMLDKSGLNDRTFGISSMTNPRTYSFICNLNTGVSRWSANAVEYFGLAGEYTDNAAEEWKSHIFPDDVTRRLFCCLHVDGWIIIKPICLSCSFIGVNCRLIQKTRPLTSMG